MNTPALHPGHWIAALLVPTAVAVAQVGLCEVRGRATGDAMGTAVAGATAPGGASYALLGAPNARGLTGANAGTVTVIGFAGGRCSPPVLLEGSQPGERFGATITRGAPGQGEALVGSPGFDPAPLVDAGAVWAVSVPNGTRLRQLFGAQGSESFGSSIAVAGDFDGDLAIDTAVGAPFAHPAVCCGAPWTYAGSVGLAADRVPGVWGVWGRIDGIRDCCGGWAEQLGHSLAEFGDVTGDGLPEFLIGSHVRNLVHVCTWDPTAMAPAIVRSDAGPGPGSFGWSVCPLDDLTGDGVREYAAGAPAAAEVRIVDGMTGAVHRALSGVDPEFGYALAEVGDQDGGGKADLLVGAPGANGGDGAAYLFSVETNHLLGVIRGADAGERLGSSVAGIADWTGDGRPELAVGAPAAGGSAGRVALVTLDARGASAGHGCAPSPCTSGTEPRAGTPRGCPYPGFARFELGVAEAMPRSTAVVFVGGLLPAPVNLGFLPCMAPCDYFIAAVASAAAPTTAATTNPGKGEGYTTVPIPVPATVPLGTRLDCQWYVVDPGGNPLTGTMTAVLSVTVVPPC